MLSLFKGFLGTYGLETSPLVAPLVFFLALFILRMIFISLVTNSIRNIDKEDRKKLRKNYKQRSFIGWLFLFAALVILIVAYYDTLPDILDDEALVWILTGTSFLLSLTLHFWAYAQAAIQTLQEKRSSIPIVS
jgi:hypothetical protein